jgi:hypothetical protein
MTSSKEIHDLISAYLKTGSLDTFAVSFAELFYDIEDTGDPAAVQLAYTVESVLAATTAGVCSKAGLDAALKALSPSLSVVVYPLEAKVQYISTYEWFTKSGAATAAVAETGKLVHVDISPSVGFGSTTVLPSTHQTNTDLPQWQQVIQAG